MLVRSISRVLGRTRVPNLVCKRLQSAAAQAISRETSFTPFGNQYNAAAIAMDIKRKYEHEHLAKFKARKLRKTAGSFLPEGNHEEILEVEVANLLSRASARRLNGHGSNFDDKSGDDVSREKQHGVFKKPVELRQEVELDIIQLSSTGDGLAYNEAKDHVFVVPFSVPGDRVLAKPWNWQGTYTHADYISVVQPSSGRDGVTPKCQYFAKCSGCQFQMLPYANQLQHKRRIVQNAFKHFSGLNPEQIPEVEPTLGSPIQYGYRTKLSPHFDGPSTNKFGNNKSRRWKDVPEIGFNIKGQRKVMDIESCPIGTDILQEGLKIERAKVIENLATYKNGATILLRESTQRSYHTEPITTSSTTATVTTSAQPQAPNAFDPIYQPCQSAAMTFDTSNQTPRIVVQYPTFTDTKTYTSNESAQATEYITTCTDASSNPPTTKTYQFTNTAGSFFQNNNSILGPFTSYIYERCLPKPASTPTTNNKPAAPPQIKYLLDAYSGSGLFTLTLSSLFSSSLGIDIDARSISAARANAARNNVTNAGFIDADASALFADVPYPPGETVVVVDPPRKGCDREFLRQLRRFGPRRVVYVSCNVHSQARDVGVLVSGFRKSKDGRGWYGGNVEMGVEFEVDREWEETGLWRYQVESLRGFDFFPQTGHVEGVCVLNRVEREEVDGESM